jgi:protein O-GlcNAc transferase
MTDGNAAARVNALTASARTARERGDPLDAALRLEAALRLAEVEGIAIDDGAHIDLGRLLLQLKRPDEAESWLRAGVTKFSKSARLHTLLGQALRALGRTDEALEALTTAAALAPEDPLPLVHRGLVSIDRRDAAGAVATFEAVVRLSPNVGEHHRLLAVAHRIGGDFARAGTEFEKALELAPKDPAAWVDLAVFREESNRGAETLPLLDRAIAAVGLHRRVVEARIAAMRRRGRHVEVAAWIETLLGENEAVGWLHFQLATTVQTSDRARANVHFARAVTLDPSNPHFVTTQAESLNRTRGSAEAENIAAGYQLARTRLELGGELRPDARALAGIFIRNADFDGFARLGSFETLGTYWAGAGSDTALQLLLSQVKTPAHRRLLVDWHRACGVRPDETARRSPLPAPTSPERAVAAPGIGGRAKIRVGLMSSDLRDHPVGYFVQPLISHYDRSRFEFYAYSWFAREADAVQTWMAHNLDGFRHRSPIADRDAAALIAEDRLDVLFDLGGSTDMNKLAVMSWRPAPRQASWLGYPHSAGLGTIDRILVDPYLEPADPALLVEKPFRMARTWVAFERPGFGTDLPITPETPEERSGHVTFGTMNNPMKYNPELIATWAEILTRLPWSRFVFVRPEGAVKSFRDNIEARFEAHGVARNRISYVPVRGQHLPHYDRIDVALDTFPQTGGTTTCETLYMGVPVVSLAGEAFFERLSNSNLHNAGLGELVVTSREAYVEKAVEIAGATAWRGELRRTMRERLRAHPLGDARGFARDFEAAIVDWMDEARS